MVLARNLTEMLYGVVQSHRGRPALQSLEENRNTSVWPYHRLWEGIYQTAAMLHEQGMDDGDRVGILSDNQPLWAVADFAILSLGACTVPLYTNLPPTQLVRLIAHAGLRGLFVGDAAQLGKLLEVSPESAPQLRFVALMKDDTSKEQMALASQRFRVISLAEVLDAEPNFARFVWEAKWRGMERSHLATIVYTSGTTGQPKGTMLTHGNFLANLEGVHEVISLAPSSKMLSYLPLAHIFERTAGQYFPLSSGACIAYSRGVRYLPEDMLRARPTHMTTVPRLLEKVMEKVEEELQHASKWKRHLFEHVHVKRMAGIDAQWGEGRRTGGGMRARVSPFLSWLVYRNLKKAMGGRMELMVVGGAHLSPEVGKFFGAAGFRVVEGYGMTEAAPVVSVNHPSDPRLGTVGRPLFNVEVRIAEDGELLVRGPNVMLGYYLDEAATSDVLDEEGWLHTGDIAALTEDGHIRIVDRKKHILVLSTGKKVVPADIERSIARSPFIDHALLVGHDRKFVSVIVAPNMAQVRQLMKDHAEQTDVVLTLLQEEVANRTVGLADYERPKAVIVLYEGFTEENGLLTPTQKIRTGKVLERCKTQLASVYGEHDSA